MLHPRLLAPTVLTALAAPLAAQTVTTSFLHAGSFAGGIAYDAVTNEVVVIDETAANVTFYDRATGTQTLQFAAPGTQPIGGQVDISTGNLWICDESETVFEVDRAGNVVSQWSTTPTIVDVSALTLDPANDTVWISNDSANIVAEFTKTGTPTGIVISPAGSTDGDGCVYDPYTRTFLMGEDTSNQILVVDRTGAAVAAYPVATLGLSPEGLAIDTTTGIVFVGNGAITLNVHEVAGIAATPPPGASTHYGTPCGARIATSDIVRDDSQTVGGTWVGYQSALPPGGFIGLNVGFTRQNLALAGVVNSPCTAYAFNDIFALIAQTNGNGRFGLRLPLPPGFQGIALTFWAADLDLSTLSIPSASDGLELVIQ